MAKNNSCDILTCDWNPVIGCVRYSQGCKRCWYLDAIFPWQLRLGNIPEGTKPNVPHRFEKRMTRDSLKPKRGIVGICQHGDLFWSRIEDATIHEILNIVDWVARNVRGRLGATKYVLWTKRARRMADFMNKRYPDGIPSYLACGVSVENQATVNLRLPHLLRINGTRFLMIEPMLGPIDLPKDLTAVRTKEPRLDWVVLGSETGGDDAVRLDPEWARSVRDQVVPKGIPFFIKQMGNSHKAPVRELDGRTWDMFPAGFRK